MSKKSGQTINIAHSIHYILKGNQKFISSFEEEVGRVHAEKLAAVCSVPGKHLVFLRCGVSPT